MRGYFAIGIEAPKTADNVGTLMRSAKSMGAAFAFTIGARYVKTPTDTCKSWLHMPLFQFPDAGSFLRSLPVDADLVGVESGVEATQPLPRYVHPERAVYVLGAEDHGLGGAILEECMTVVEIPDCAMCLNVATAGGIVLYDRRAKSMIPSQQKPGPTGDSA